MINIIKSALYKLSKDWTFRITLIVGVSLAVLMNLIYLGIDLASSRQGIAEHLFCNGQSMLINSLSPAQNFGIAIPINLIVYTIGEFSNGTIRNKIIAGHKKSFIYISMLFIGVIFSLTLMIVYCGLSVAIGSIIGGFNAYGTTMIGDNLTPTIIGQYLLMSLCVYIFIVALTIFFATLFRNIGATTPVVILLIVFLFIAGMTSYASNIIDGAKSPELVSDAMIWINPLYTFGVYSVVIKELPSDWAIASCITPLYWALLFGVIGTKIFSRRDIK